MGKDNKPIANPLIVFREEFSDWAVLFHPDSGKGFGLNPVGKFIWKHLDGKHTVQEILSKISKNWENVSEDAEEHLKVFIQELVENGLAGYNLLED